ncbi:putative permease [Granulicella aggregans]|uniref:Putative permease n=1 Tax=Granulicella aggregans TaxID=474949 RepID=A0A7W7ZBK0_9BACT|nr:ABC transporter permease [Granulicella aggregans]MBB5056880.1 putative permease [Granulicella aggregans]
MLNQAMHDMRYALRQLRRSPGFTATAVLTLGLGIGVTTAMYSIVRGTLLAPLPYPHAEELVGVGWRHAGEPPSAEQTGETGDLLLANAKSFASIGLADDGPLGQNFSDGRGSATTIRSIHVTSGYLPTLGFAPLLGRTFTREEDTPGAAPTVVLSEKLWRTMLNADHGIVGRVIHINGDPYTVIGVMPSALATVDTPDAWQPMQLSAKTAGYEGDNFQMIARLRPEVSMAQASGELAGLTKAIYQQYPGYAKRGGAGAAPLSERVWPLRDVVVSDARPSLIALSLAVLAVLLMACLNLAGLITARASSRRAEIALRTALGAGRIAVMRLLLLESLLLALCGSVLGIGLAYMVVPMLLASSPIDLPQMNRVVMDLPVSAFAIFVGIATTLIFGLVPALGVFRQSTETQLGASRTAGAGVSQQRMGRVLIVAQVALATVLLSVGALLTNAFLRMRAIPPGVVPEHLYTLQVNLKGARYTSSARSQQFVQSVEEKLRGIPGVAKVATVNGLPLDSGLNDVGYPAGHKELEGTVEARFVTPGYFQAVGTTLLQGRDLSSSDTETSPRVVLINQRAASLWWPGRSAIGEYVFDLDTNTPSRVVGVVADTHVRSIADKVNPASYHAYAQVPDDVMKPINGWFATTFVMRTFESAGNLPIAEAAEASIAEVDAEVPTAKFAAMQSYIDKGVAAPRFFTWLAGGFAGFSLLLTVVGLFGLLSYQVGSRTRELGVRIALGAQRGQVLGLVLGSGLALTAIGLAAGAMGGFAVRGVVASLLSSTIYVNASEAASLLGNEGLAIAIAAFAMLVSAMAASLIPARRAASIEPMEALRNE